MKNLTTFVILAVFGGLLSIGVSEATTGCTPQMRKDIAHTAIDILLASCIAEHPDADEPELKAVCKYTEENAEAVKSLIAARKRGMAKAGAVKCASAPDGGK